MELAAGTLIRDRYEVLAPLGGATWKVQDRQTQGLAVLKRLSGRGVPDEATLTEAIEARRSLEVPGLPAIHDALFVEMGAHGEWFVIREYVEGVPLVDAVARRRGLNPDHVRWLAGELLWLLEQLHDAGLVHGDVCPSNILLAAEGTEVWLVDHGPLKAAARSGLGGGWSLAADERFASPEVAMGGVSPRSDLFALGQTLVYALTGRAPQEVDREALQGAGKDRGYDVDRGLVRVLLKLAEPLAEGRFETAAEATRAIAHGLQEQDARPWWEKDFFLEPDDDARGLALKLNALWLLLAALPFLACTLVLLPPLGTFTSSLGSFVQAVLGLGVLVVGFGLLASAVPWAWAAHNRMVHVSESSLAARSREGWLRVPWRHVRVIRKRGPALIIEGHWESDEAMGRGTDAVALMDVYDVELKQLEDILQRRRPASADQLAAPVREGVLSVRLVAGLPPTLQLAVGLAGLAVPLFGLLAIAWGAGLLHEREAPERSSWQAESAERATGPWEERVPNPVTTGGVGEAPTLVWAMACPPGMYASSVSAHGHRLMSCEDLNGEMVGVPGVSGTERAPFLADRAEVTVRLYEACVTAGSCEEPERGEACNWGRPGKETHPVNCLDFERAAAFCSWGHKRLCGGEEFERLAGGPQGYAYPWGGAAPSCEVAVMDEERAGCGKDGTWSAGSRAGGISPVGALDASGNVAEWTADAHVRGGSWRSGGAAELLSTAAQEGGRASPEVGLRCCKSY